MVANIMKSFENIVTPTADTPIQPVSEFSGITLGEAVMLAKQKKPDAPAPAATEAIAPATPAAPAAPATPPAETTPAKPSITKKKPLPESPAPTTTAPATAPAPVVESGLSADDKTYIDGLTPEQKDEVEIAQFAETHGHPGKLAATLKYFRDLDKLIATNGDLTPESEEYVKFTAENAPKWNSSAKKKVEREMILDQATKKAREESQPLIQEQQRKLRELELKSSTDEHVEALVGKMSSTEIAKDGAPAIDPEVIEYIREHGYDKAAKKFKVEAPIIMGSINAERVWLGFSNGTLNYNPNDQLHNWVIGFLQGEGARMKQLPAKDRIQNGKEFLPLQEYAAEFSKNPQEAAAKYYTFNDDMVRDLLAANAVLSVNQQIADLEESGFKYERKLKKTPVAENQPLEQPPVSGSPGVGFRAMPGAGELPSPAKDPRAEYFEKLVPGGAKMAGIG